MKKNIVNFVLLAGLTAAFFSCQKEEIGLNNKDTEGFSIYASVGIDSKIAFEDIGTGVKVAWIKGEDEITVFGSDGNRIGDIVCNDVDASTGIGQFKAPVGDPVYNYMSQSNAKATLIYPSTGAISLDEITYHYNDKTQVRNGSINHCSEQTYLRALFDSNNHGITAFEHLSTMLTVTVPPADATPLYAALTIGEDLPIRLNLSNVTDWSSQPLKLYFIVPPKAGGAELKLNVYTTGENFYPFSYSSSKAWAAGKRYTAAMAPQATIKGYRLSEFIDLTDPLNPTPIYIDLPKEVLILDDISSIEIGLEEDSEYDYFLKSLQLENNASKDFTLVFANSQKVPSTFKQQIINNNVSNLKILSFPKATVIENQSFQNLINITSINCPLVTTIGSSAFNGCSSLTSISLPSAFSIGATAFRYCPLTYLDLGSTTLQIVSTMAVGNSSPFRDTTPANIDLLLNKNEPTSGNVWQGITFKSITKKH